jgi:hypothetical protein
MCGSIGRHRRLARKRQRGRRGADSVERDDSGRRDDRFVQRAHVAPGVEHERVDLRDGLRRAEQRRVDGDAVAETGARLKPPRDEVEELFHVPRRCCATAFLNFVARRLSSTSSRDGF